ncbi:MAG: hypothetical protein MK085_02580 [Phycisphaerales bacterium]|nr:hypothetical protein [Phycisphaerales bacterium]
MNRTWVSVLAVLPCCAVVSSSSHAEFDLVYDGMVHFEGVNYTYDSSGILGWDSATRNTTHYAHAGLINFNGGDLQGYCIELSEGVAEGPAPYEWQGFGFGINDYESPLGESDARLMERMAYVAGLYDSYYELSTQSRSASAAFAMMTWELTHENFTSGEPSLWNDQVRLEEGAMQFGNVSEEAREVFDQMRLTLFQSSVDGLMALNNDGGSSSEGFQDFVTTVPSPSAIGLAVLAGLGRGRRRRN